MATNINSVNGQTPVQLYQQNQAGTAPGSQPDTSPGAAPNAAVRVDISPKARELQTRGGNRAEATTRPQQKTNQGGAAQDNTRVKTSSQTTARQNQPVQGRQDTGETEKTASNEQAVQAQPPRQEARTSNPAQPIPGTPDLINLIA